MSKPHVCLEPSVPPSPYGAFYYRHCCGRPYARDAEWLALFDRIAAKIVERIQPRSALDAGCAFGLLVERLRDRGVEAEGVDVSVFALAQAHESVAPYCRVASLVDPLERRYDLIVCIEVLEHLPSGQADAAIANLCACTNDILFSSSPYDMREPTHVNVNPIEHWAELFAVHGFYRDVDFDASFVTPWAVRFRRRTEPLHRIVRGYERRYAHLQRERDEARAYSLQVQGEYEASEAARESLARSHQEARAALLKTQDELRMALDAVHHMRRSVFWRARGAYVAVRRTLGFGG